jgi:hypothetical protein
MQQSSSWSANNLSAGQVTPRLLSNPKARIWKHQTSPQSVALPARVRTVLQHLQRSGSLLRQVVSIKSYVEHSASLGPSLRIHCCVHRVLVHGRRGKANNMAPIHTDIL